MNVTVCFFASLRTLTGVRECALDLPEGSTLAQAVSCLIAQYPALAGHEATWHYAINQTHADAETVLEVGDRVAVFPYLAGG